MRPLPLLALLTTAFLTTACFHRLTLQAPDGAGGTGSATRGIGAGSIEATINGQRYEGRWTAATEGGVAFGSLISGSRMATCSMGVSLWVARPAAVRGGRHAALRVRLRGA